MTPQQFSAKLSDKLLLNEQFVQFTFEVVEPHRLEFSAGQYISVKVSPHGDRRSYSICSSPEKSHGFDLLVDLKPNGIGVQYLNTLKFGDSIACLAPLGLFTVSEAIVGKNPLVLVASGSGIAPMPSILFDQLQLRHNQMPIELHWGMRYTELLFWEETFTELSESFHNFRFHPVISKPVPAWPLCQGRVTDCLRTHDLIPNAHYFLCGNDTMIKDVMTLLTERNVPKDHMHHESFN